MLPYHDEQSIEKESSHAKYEPHACICSRIDDKTTPRHDEEERACTRAKTGRRKEGEKREERERGERREERERVRERER